MFTYPYGTFAYCRMPFGLCNALATLQRCMTTIFFDFLENIMEVFMDDFSVYRGTFYLCLENFTKVLRRCKEVNLVLNQEKCHFMFQEGVVLGHVIFDRGIEVDKAKIQVIEHLPLLTSIKGVQSFLGYVGFYCRLINYFSKIAKPLTQLLAKDVPFVSTDECHEAFCKIKQALISTPIIQPPGQDLPFEIMCDANDHAVGAVLVQRKDKKPILIYYSSRTLNKAQQNHTTSENELPRIVDAMEMSRPYLLCSKVIVYTNH